MGTGQIVVGFTGRQFGKSSLHSETSWKWFILITQTKQLIHYLDNPLS